jgi:peptidyl-prolyl cis-trans isomerase C
MIAPDSLEDRKMNRFDGSGYTGALVAIVLLAATTTAGAETALTINGVAIDNSVIDFYVQSRSQKPVTEVTKDERAALVEELTDIYLLTTQPRAKELAKSDQVQAQLELQKRGLLAQVIASDFLERNQASDEEILAEYANQVKVAPPEQFKARHILVETQGSATDLVKQLDGGADFQELAKEHSTGPSGPNGGDLGWFSPDQMVAPFSEAVSNLKNGEYTKTPVQTQFGWHVILREDSRESEAPTLDSVRDVVKQRVEQRKLQDYLAQLRELNAKE